MIREVLLLSAAAVLALSGWRLGRATEAGAAWPAAGSELRVRRATFPPGFAKRRVLLDPGHGAPGNTGNRSSFCVDEQDFTLALARDVATHLSGTGHFDVKLAREPGELVPYPDRVELAQRWPADVIISLHSDVRGQRHDWQPQRGRSCPQSHDAPGFSVLWSDHGEERLAGERHALARAVALELGAAGLSPYAGAEYGLDYAGDETLGVYVDRHPERERVFMLWKPGITSVLIETHNALDDREAERWELSETREAFASALSRALVAWLG